MTVVSSTLLSKNTSGCVPLDKFTPNVHSGIFNFLIYIWKLDCNQHDLEMGSGWDIIFPLPKVTAACDGDAINASTRLHFISRDIS